MKGQWQILQVEVEREEYMALVKDEQRYVILHRVVVGKLGRGDFIELIYWMDEDAKHNGEAFRSLRYLVRVTHVGLIQELGPGYRIISVVGVADISLGRRHRIY